MKIRIRVAWVLLALAALAAANVIACGDGNGGAAVDPRCNSLCTIQEPELQGAYDICNTASAEQCKQECTARIADVKSLCASCLLENACFDTECDAQGGDSPNCDESGQCTINGREGSCTYAVGDDAARDNCIRQVEPRREVQCTTEYRSVSECAAECADSAAPDAGN